MTNTEASTNARIKWLLIAGCAFVAVSAFLLVWIPFQRQVRLFEDIIAMGGEVRSHNVGPDWLRRLVGHKGTSGYDAIYRVTLVEVPIDDALLKRIGRLSNLRGLRLYGTPISDGGLKHLARLSNLEELLLNDTQISDEGMKHLAALSNVKVLSLDGTQFSDDGLGQLAGLVNLQELYLTNTRVSDDGLKKLKQALPDYCYIEK